MYLQLTLIKLKLLDIIKRCSDVAITRSSTDVDEKFLKCSSKLKSNYRAGVGYDNVDIEGCSKRGIIIWMFQLQTQ